MTRATNVLRRRRPRVLAEVSGRLRVERGPFYSLGYPEKLAICAHYSTEPRVTRSFRTLVREFANAGYLPVVVSAAEFPERLDWGGGLHPEAVVLRKPNVGYDFGSWAVGLTYVPGAHAADKVILANDSLVGPFATIAPFLAEFESCRTDTWALTDSHQHLHHLQSFFLGFRGGILQDDPLWRFFTRIHHERTKWDIIRKNELGLSKLLYTNGYTRTAHFRASDLGVGPRNPVITAWWQLLELGFPFVKREIVLKPSVATRGEWVAREVESVFGARLSDWL